MASRKTIVIIAASNERMTIKKSFFLNDIPLDPTRLAALSGEVCGRVRLVAFAGEVVRGRRVVTLLGRAAGTAD